MNEFSDNQNCKDQLSWIAIRVAHRCLLLTICTFVALSAHQTLGQSKSAPLCNRDDALEMIGQQIASTRTFDNAVRRVAVLMRAADLLWPVQKDKARATFSEAFEVAVQNEKEKTQAKDLARSLIIELQTPDQRYVVIRAIAKRDSAWAKKLTAEMLKQDRQISEQVSTRDTFNDVLTGYKLLSSATQQVSSDINAAMDLAITSLRYPATAELSRFLYKLAEVNQLAADRLYEQALAAYADRPMREFLYLLSYPFAFPDSNNMPVSGAYKVPANFVSNNSLQRRFVQTLLRRAQQALEVPLDEGDTFNRQPGIEHVVEVLTRIEPHVRALLPDLSGPVTQAREKILVSLPFETQKELRSPGADEVSSATALAFNEQIEAAEKTPDVNLRDDLVATAVLYASDKESLADVVDAIEKITDSSIRAALLEWLYFRRAKDAADNKRFDEAERLVSKVEGREQRAYLHITIAKALLNAGESPTQAREVLERALTEANKAGMTIFAARTLLTASNLYAKIDLSRSISVLGDAINSVNHLEAPDFFIDNQTLVKTVPRSSNAGTFPIRFYMPGLDPESAVREMAKIDFNNALSQAGAFTDKFQRAITTLALADVCLQQVPPLKDKPKRDRR
ncbi:MAG TPA: hypothetical protein VGW76_01200 [Pyrinomonadaceae bacterium]|nr:hypothetical protein [Pyrinomonadaceae bacterium]